MSITYFGQVNRCIYCGADDCRLTDEHIVPFGLGGTAVLEKASCIPCGVITGKFEGVVQRGIFGDFRILRNMPTQRELELLHTSPDEGLTIEHKSWSDLDMIM